MSEVFDYAFRPLADGGAGLDFITLSDYVTPAAWGEIGRYQDAYPDNLIIRSSEIITYTGHTNNHASVTYVDHRTGPVYEWLGDGTVAPLRGARPASALFREVRQHRGWTQINHPTIFPSSDPTLRRFCRGCPWDFTRRGDATSRWSTRSRSRPGRRTSAPRRTRSRRPRSRSGRARSTRATRSPPWARATRTRRAASSRSTSAPIGHATTVVYARDLSEQGIRDARPRGPHLRQAARQRRSGPAPRGPHRRRQARDHGRHAVHARRPT